MPFYLIPQMELFFSWDSRYLSIKKTQVPNRISLNIVIKFDRTQKYQLKWLDYAYQLKFTLGFNIVSVLLSNKTYITPLA
jgi:hypothetical protein